MPKGKPEPKPSPSDKRKERDEMIEKASLAFQTAMMEIVQEFGLSSAEVFSILSNSMADIAASAMDAEHEEYFGPREDEEAEGE